jgi:2-polyprenyl-6-methoxyphenol hydroxylase-like FAD-dependent oxidoreductase
MSITDDIPLSPDNTNTANNGTPASQLPIVIAGGGCVGLFLALLLAHSLPPSSSSSAPLPRIIVLEPHAPDPTATRAMAHQPPTYPLLSQVPGLLPELIAAGSLSSGLCFRKSERCGGAVIAGKKFDNGDVGGGKGKGQLLLPQGKFQAVLLKRLAELGRDRVDVRLGWALSSFDSTTTPSRVLVHTHHAATNATASLEATYLIGADGAHSTVRRTLGLAFPGTTLDAQLVATDIHFDFAAHGYHDANFVIDPVDYGLIGRIDPAGALWRVSYGVPAGLSEAEVRDGVAAKLSAMLPGGGADGFEIVRVAPYLAQQRCVEAFWTGRVGLVGDAAHCIPTPPLPLPPFILNPANHHPKPQ